MKRAFLIVGFLFSAALAAAQERTISGIVTAADDGSPLIAATVEVKGSSVRVKTNKNGCFTITASGDATLVVKYNGFKTQEVPVRHRTLVEVVLQSEESDNQAWLYRETEP